VGAEVERSVIRRKINIFLLVIPIVLLREPLVERLSGLLAGLSDTQQVILVNFVFFILAAVTLIPLAGFVESAVEELAELLGPFIGGLLHTTFGNVAELTIGLSVLLSFAGSGGANIVLGSIAGVIIRNSLLFLGLATVMGCWRNGHMHFSAENASEYTTIFALAIVGLSLPTIANSVFPHATQQELAAFGRFPVSAFLAVVLVISYCAYIFFSVFRFREGYDLIREDRKRRLARHLHRLLQRRQREQGTRARREPVPALAAPLDTRALFREERESAALRLAGSEAPARPRPKTSRPKAQVKRAYARAALLEHKRQQRAERGEEGVLAGHRGWRGVIALLVLGIATAGVASMSEAFAHSVEELATHSATLRTYDFFLGLIIIPVLAGLVEFYGSIDAARKDRMEITMAVTAGATIQMVLLVVPILVLVGALTGHTLSLIFQPFDLIIFGAATFIFMLLSRDGESTWLEGVQLCTLWLLVAVTALFLRSHGAP
jgi:Ca2+:H+ antiporter